MDITNLVVTLTNTESQIVVLDNTKLNYLIAIITINVIYVLIISAELYIWISDHWGRGCNPLPNLY